jgi:hypothetical protein
MLDKQMAKRLSVLTGNKEVWEAFKEHLNSLRTLELRVLVTATSEPELYRSQGKINSLERLERLKDEVEEAKGRNAEV